MSPLWHLSQFPLSLKAFLPLWQAPQYFPFLLSISRISVVLVFMLKSSSVWQTRQVYFGLCFQCENATGRMPFLAEVRFMMILPYSIGVGSGGKSKVSPH